MTFLHLLICFISIALQANTPPLVDRIQAIDPNNFYDELMKGSGNNIPLKTDLQFKRLSPEEQEALKKKIKQVKESCYKKAIELESQKKHLSEQSDSPERIKHGIIGAIVSLVLTCIFTGPQTSRDTSDTCIIVCGTTVGTLIGHAVPTSLDLEKMELAGKIYDNSRSQEAALALSQVLEKKLTPELTQYQSFIQEHTYPWYSIDRELEDILQYFSDINK
jgi:hypothetical protein